MKDQFKYILALLLGVIVGLYGCLKIDDLPRNNPYDSEADQKEVPKDYSLSLSNWRIIEESKIEDGFLQQNENMYIQLTVKNNGPDVGRLEKVWFEGDLDNFTVSVKPEETLDRFDWEGVVDDFIDPGETVVPVTSFTTPDKDIRYTIKLYAFQAADSGTVLTVTVHMEDFKQATYEDSFQITVH